MAVCVHLLLLLAPFLSICGATQYYVTPTEPTDTSCPAQPCHTLNYYTNHSDRYFKSNTVFKFLPGTHLMNRLLEIRDVENISLEASDDNSDMYPQLVAQFTCQYGADTACIQIKYLYTIHVCSAIRMINVTHAAIEGINVTVATPYISGIILQQCSHLHIKSIAYIGIQERCNDSSTLANTLLCKHKLQPHHSGECGLLSYNSSDIEMDSLEASNFMVGVVLSKSRNTSMMNVSAVHNCVNGIHLYCCTDTRIMNASAVHNLHNGILLDETYGTSIMNISAVHNVMTGIVLLTSTNTSMMNISAVHNQEYAILLS